MSLQAILRSSVDQAFAAAGDLVRSGLFESVSAPVFDFQTSEYEQLVDTVTAPILVYTENSQEVGPLSDSRFGLVKDSDIKPKFFTKVTVDGTEYRIEQIEQYEGFAKLTLRGL